MRDCRNLREVCYELGRGLSRDLSAHMKGPFEGEVSGAGLGFDLPISPPGCPDRPRQLRHHGLLGQWPTEAFMMTLS
jgi:hypothetical protein